MRSGNEQWAATWARGDSVVVAGDRLLIFGAAGDSTPQASLSTVVRNWPRGAGSPAGD